MFCISEPVCANKVRNGPASADQGFSTASQGSCHVHGTPSFLQPAKAAAMCTAPWAETRLPPHIQPFFASAKTIFEMDCANW